MIPNGKNYWRDWNQYIQSLNNDFNSFYLYQKFFHSHFSILNTTAVDGLEDLIKILKQEKFLIETKDNTDKTVYLIIGSRLDSYQGIFIPFNNALLVFDPSIIAELEKTTDQIQINNQTEEIDINNKKFKFHEINENEIIFSIRNFDNSYKEHLSNNTKDDPNLLSVTSLNDYIFILKNTTA